MALAACLLLLAGPAGAENAQAQLAAAKLELARLRRDSDPDAQIKKISRAANPQFFVGNDVWSPGRKFSNTKDWLALVCRTDGCGLVNAELTVSSQRVQGNSDDQPTFGQRLHFKAAAGGAKAVAWFKSSAALPWLKPGDIPAYYSGTGATKPTGNGNWEIRVDLASDEVATLVPLLLSSKYSPELAADLASDGADGPHFLLQLRANGVRQLLPGEFSSCDFPILNRSYLLWAGDLDGDGKPDYLIRFAGEDGPVQFYLSGSARPGQLVGLAGVFSPPPSDAECEGNVPEL